MLTFFLFFNITENPVQAANIDDRFNFFDIELFQVYIVK